MKELRALDSQGLPHPGCMSERNQRQDIWITGATRQTETVTGHQGKPWVKFMTVFQHTAIGKEKECWNPP